MIPIRLNFNVDPEKITNLLISAFEGGSNYWIARRVEITRKPTLPYDGYGSSVPMAGGEISIAELVNDNTGEINMHTLDQEKCIKGLEIMAEKYPRHFSDWVSENDDAVTGDVFLQVSLFGTVVYG